MIRIENLYMMLAYAWDRLDYAGLVDVSGLPQKNLQNLLARLLCSGVRSLLHRGQLMAHIEVSGEMATIRGRVDITASVNSGLLSRGRLICVYDEYSLDTLPNQIIRSTMHTLAKCDEVAKELRAELRSLCRQFTNVSECRVTPETLRVASRRHDTSIYGLLLDVCRMVHDELLPSQAEGAYRFKDFFRDEGKMRLVFQNFLYKFYQKELAEFSVSAKYIDWHVTAVKGQEHLLPSMRTDISIWSSTRYIILDAKYTPKVFNQYYNKKSLQSEHLYQISTYLTQQSAHLQPRHGACVDDDTTVSAVSPEGILIYPLADDYVDAEYSISGRRLTVVTVDLAQDWNTVHARLLEIVRR